jgi:hypothetical protein
VKHQAITDCVKTDASSQFIELPFQLARRHMAAVGQFCYPELAFRMVKQLCAFSRTQKRFT